MNSRLKAFFSIPDRPVKGRITLLASACFLIYLCSIVTLAFAWYQVDTTVPFHWFDDSRGWLFIDKFGHFFTVFFVASILSKVWRWTGLSRDRALWLAAAIAFLNHSSYEIFDGYSAGYGASVYDLLANFLGASFLLVQQLVWRKLKIFPRLSFHPSVYAHLRPAFFGDNFFHQLLKDYNGHTFWFSLDVNAIIKRKVLPSWLLISIGYGADGLLGGDDNIWTDKEGRTHDFSQIPRSARFMLSVDINWEHFHHPYLKKIAAIFIYVKFPAPALEISMTNGVRWHWVYF